MRDDLIAQLDVMRSEADHVRTRCVMNIAMSESDRYPHLFEKFRKTAIEPRRRVLKGIIERGIASGELCADLDPDLGMAILSGTMIWHTKWAAQDEFGPELAVRIVDQVLAGLAP